MKTSAQMFRTSNLNGLAALIAFVASVGAITAAFALLPSMPGYAWAGLTAGLLGLIAAICLTFKAVHSALNGYAAARDE